MGNQCAKAGTGADILDMRDDKDRRAYYLNQQPEPGIRNSKKRELSSPNYDITEQKRVGYGHI